MVPVIAAVVAFVAVNAGTLPTPEPPKPMAVLEFVHENVAPTGTLVNPANGTLPPLQTVIGPGTFTVGFGLITTVTVDEAVHPATLATTVYVPADVAVTPVILGFCRADAKALGPVQA
jgi:hypothetical protein